MTETNSAIEISDLTFGWKQDQTNLQIPKFIVPTGSKIFLNGNSGSGKSTLLSLIAGVLEASGGQIKVFENRLDKMSPSKKDQFRADKIGVIFQMFNLLPYLSVGSNVCLPCRFSNQRSKRVLEEYDSIVEGASSLLESLGLPADQFWKAPANELSVGQQQRVAAARALIGSPDLIIADEPTSALDEENSKNFVSLLLSQVEKRNSTLLFVSHDKNLGEFFDTSVDIASLNITPANGEG